MARRLAEAAAHRDWRALAAADGELAAVLPVLARQGDWSAHERRALAELQRAHRTAREACDGESQRLERLLADMREGKDGRLAYAMTEDWEENLA